MQSLQCLVFNAFQINSSAINYIEEMEGRNRSRDIEMAIMLDSKQVRLLFGVCDLLQYCNRAKTTGEKSNFEFFFNFLMTK